MFEQEKGDCTEFRDAATGMNHFEAHGDRWSSLDDNDALALAVVMDRLFQRGGFAVEELPGRYDMLIQPSGDCRAAALVSENEEGEPGVDSVYPVLRGRRNALSVAHVHEWLMPVQAEAEVYAAPFGTSGELADALVFFDPFYCRDREVLAALKASGEGADFLLSAWAYRAAPAGEKPAPALRRHQVASEYLFRLTVRDVAPAEFCGYPVWKLGVDFGEGGPQELPAFLYAPERALNGLVPQAGDVLEGQLWLCGHLASAFEEWNG